MIIVALTAGALELIAPWTLGDPQRAALDHLPTEHAQAYRLAASSQVTARWFSFAARWGSATTWPRGQTIALELKDGRVLEAASVMVMTPRPRMTPVLLGLADRRLDPHELEAGSDGRTVVLASFSDPDIGRRDVRGVQVRQRSKPGAAPPGSPGGSP